MIGKLTGNIESNGISPVLVSVNGVGYCVHVPNTLANTLEPNSMQSLYIHTHVREDALDLFGFSTKDDLMLFELLLTVSGIGPKTALLVLDRGSDTIQKAVRESDVDFFTKIPRLGKKNAQKIIIELKNKIGSLTDLNLKDSNDSETKQLVEALTAMGYKRNRIIDALKTLDGKTLSLEQKIQHIIKII